MDDTSMKNDYLKIFDKYVDAIFRFCLIKTSHTEVAEDITQEVFMQLWQALRSGNKMTNTKAFLYTIARNRVIDWYRKRKNVSLDTLQDAGFDVKDTSLQSSPKIAAEYTELLSIIMEMKETDREVLVLRYVEGLEP